MGWLKMKKIKPKMKVLISLFIICVLVVGGVFSYTFYQLNKIKTVKISKTDKDLGINSKTENAKGITNIAFFGLDRTQKDEASRSDSIIIFSIDTKNNKIKMSSIMRDTYVKIKDNGETKISQQPVSF